jgi:peptide/nickel transport system substrate-binding protein
MDVTVWTYPAVRAWAQHVVSVLRRLGYRSSLLSTRDPTSYSERILVPNTPAQIGVGAWWADNAAPSQFAEPFICGSNAGFCDRGFDARVKAAKAASGPEAAARWKEAYAYLAKAAPGVPSVNRRTVVFLSDRVGNYQHHPVGIGLLEQLWVR